MGGNELITSIIEKFVVSIPELVATIAIIIAYLKKINVKTDLFPNQVESLKANLTDSFTSSKKKLEESFFQTTSDIKEITKSAVEGIAERVNGELSSMQEELNSYKENLIVVKEQSNLLVKENLAYVQTIVDLLGMDFAKIKSGVAEKVVNNLNFTKEELKKYPETLINNIPLLEKALKEIIELSGSEQIEKILERVGYEKKAKTEELQTKKQKL